MNEDLNTDRMYSALKTLRAVTQWHPDQDAATVVESAARTILDLQRRLPEHAVEASRALEAAGVSSS